MKKLTLLSIALISFFALSVTVVYTSCTSDPCKDVLCQNGGTPVATGDACNCSCTAGYEGTDCATVTRDKFLGVGTVNDNCSLSGTPSYVVTITAGTAITEVKIANFWNAFTHNVIATVSGTSISIATQEPDSDGFTISGSGTISGKIITLSYTVTDTSTGDQDICTSTTITLP